jgi:hypothetical protein
MGRTSLHLLLGVGHAHRDGSRPVLLRTGQLSARPGRVLPRREMESARWRRVGFPDGAPGRRGPNVLGWWGVPAGRAAVQVGGGRARILARTWGRSSCPVGSRRVVWPAWGMTRPRRCKRTPERSWAGICPAWLRFVGSCGHVSSDLRLYRWQQLRVDHHGWSCQGHPKDSHASRRLQRSCRVSPLSLVRSKSRSTCAGHGQLVFVVIVPLRPPRQIAQG